MNKYINLLKEAKDLFMLLSENEKLANKLILTLFGLTFLMKLAAILHAIAPNGFIH